MSTLTIRMPDATHERLKELARARRVSINKLIEEFSTAALAEFDAEVRFRACAGWHAGAPAGQNRPLRDGTAIRIGVVVKRFQAGGPIEALVPDHGRRKEDIEGVIRCELPRPA